MVWDRVTSSGMSQSWPSESVAESVSFEDEVVEFVSPHALKQATLRDTLAQVAWPRGVGARCRMRRGARNGRDLNTTQPSPGHVYLGL